MDFPDPQELQWLEANNSTFEEEGFDFELPPYPPSEPEPPESPEPEPQKPNLESTLPSSKPTLSLPPKPSIAKPTQGNGKKRFRFDDGQELLGPGDVGLAAEDKRSRVDSGDGKKDGGKQEGADKVDDGHDEDEDWLRYSPPLAGNGNADVPMVAEEEVKERFLSKYVAEIDGDCVPVTGLDGERVYAKICRVENVERVKKLNVRGDFEG